MATPADMGDMFSGLLGSTEQNPSPIVLPDIRYQFSEQRDQRTGEVIAILLQIWFTSLPVLQFVIPFDRLSFAHFANAANRMIQDRAESNGGDD